MKGYTTAVDPRIDEAPEQSQSLHPGGQTPQDVMTRDGGRGRGRTQALVIQQASMPSAQSFAPAITLVEAPLFRYRVLGQLATVGHYKGVGTIDPLKVSGFPAWWLWRSYYLYRLPRLEKRLRVMFDWTLDLLFGRDIVQLSIATTKSLDEDR